MAATSRRRLVRVFSNLQIIVQASWMSQVGRRWLSGCSIARPRLLEELHRLCVVPDLSVDAAQKPEEIRIAHQPRPHARRHSLSVGQRGKILPRRYEEP